MAKKTEAQVQKIEREYIIPLRKKYRVVPRYKKTPKAVRAVKMFLLKHMKIYDKDLNKIKLDKYVNEFIWARGIKKPPHKIKVKATKEGGIVKVELVDFPNKLKFKKLKEERTEKMAKEIHEKKKAEKSLEEKIADQEKPEEEKTEEKEKKAAVVEVGKEIEKAAAKQMKHQSKQKTKEPKHQRRMALQK